MSESKEPGYFVEELNWSQAKAWYLRLFEASGDAQIIGESSTRSPPLLWIRLPSSKRYDPGSWSRSVP
jgi:hypothetical protein